MKSTLLAFLVTVMILAAGCGDDGDDTAAEGTAAEDTAAEDTTAAEPADLQLSSSDLGDILVDADGNTLYLFLPDEQGDSTCYDECEANWPVVGALASVAEGLDAGLLGTTERTTGDIQATYNGWPLYYFAADEATGDANGQGVNDVWYVLDAAGDPVGAG